MADAAFAVEIIDGAPALCALHRADFKPLIVDWASAEQRRRIAGGRRQLLARAVGLHRKPGLRVIDATAGLGRDGFTLAALGAEVQLVERCAPLAELLEQALRKVYGSSEPPLAAAAARIHIVRADAISWLAEHGQDADVVHLDPMYPHEDRRALPQKAMQMLRELAGDDDDAPELLQAALHSGASRVVVKRPNGAPPLAGPAPDLNMAGTQARYDVYLRA